MTIGELCTAELVLSKIFYVIFPHLDSLLSQSLSNTNFSDHNSSTSAGILCAIMEIIQVLGGLLPGLSAETVAEYYLQPSKWSVVSIPNLLVILPLSVPNIQLTNTENDEEVKTYD